MKQQVMAPATKPGGKTKGGQSKSSQDKVIDLSGKEFQWGWIFKPLSSALLNSLFYLYPGTQLSVVHERDDGNSYVNITYLCKTSYN